MSEKIKIPEESVYRHDLKIREVGGSSTAFEVTLPRRIVRRYAEEHDISLEEATTHLRVQIISDDFEPPGIFVKFLEEEEK